MCIVLVIGRSIFPMAILRVTIVGMVGVGIAMSPLSARPPRLSRST